MAHERAVRRVVRESLTPEDTESHGVKYLCSGSLFSLCFSVPCVFKKETADEIDARADSLLFYLGGQRARQS